MRPLNQRAAGEQLRGTRSQADRERDDEAGRPHHPPRAEPAAGDADRGGVDGVPAQRLGPRVRAAREPRDEVAQEDRDRGAGQEALGEAVGDAEGWHELA